jgi:hypothetical protein
MSLGPRRVCVPTASGWSCVSREIYKVEQRKIPRYSRVLYHQKGTRTRIWVQEPFYLQPMWVESRDVCGPEGLRSWAATRTDTRLVPQCPHPHLRRVSLSVGYPFPRNPGECGHFHVRVVLKSSWLPGEAGGCPYPSARGGRGGLGAQDVVEIPTCPRNKNAALPVRTHKSPLTLSGLKKTRMAN